MTSPVGDSGDTMAPFKDHRGRFVAGHKRVGGRRRGGKSTKQGESVERERDAQSPPARPEPTRTALLALVDELGDIAARLRAPGLTDSDRSTLRLRADVASRRIIALEKLRRMPPEPDADPESWLRELAEPEDPPDAPQEPAAMTF